MRDLGRGTFALLRATSGPDARAALAILSVIQRFGSAVNLHVHAVVSETVRTLTQRVRRKILRRMVRIGTVPKEAVEEMLARSHGGFSLDGKVRIGADDRAGLERLLS